MSRNVTGAPAALAQAMEEEWGNLDDIDHAHDTLKSADVVVTNQRDKTVQLKKMYEFNVRAIASFRSTTGGHAATNGDAKAKAEKIETVNARRLSV